jgi:hypothetical protein
VTPLERRYHRLMITYPTEYRQQHQSEILATLPEGRAWRCVAQLA